MAIDEYTALASKMQDEQTAMSSHHLEVKRRIGCDRQRYTLAEGSRLLTEHQHIDIRPRLCIAARYTSEEHYRVVLVAQFRQR